MILYARPTTLVTTILALASAVVPEIGYDSGIDLQKSYKKDNNKAFLLTSLRMQSRDDKKGYDEQSHVDHHAADANRDCCWCGGGTPGKQSAIPCMATSRDAKT